MEKSGKVRKQEDEVCHCRVLVLLAHLPLQQRHFIREEMSHILLSKDRGEQEAECRAGCGEQTGQYQTLPGPEYCTS